VAVDAEKEVAEIACGFVGADQWWGGVLRMRFVVEEQLDFGVDFDARSGAVLGGGVNMTCQPH
jgi:hypothetical protein